MKHDIALVYVTQHGQDVALYLNGAQITDADPLDGESTSEVEAIARRLSKVLGSPTRTVSVVPEAFDWMWCDLENTLRERGDLPTEGYSDPSAGPDEPDGPWATGWNSRVALFNSDEISDLELDFLSFTRADAESAGYCVQRLSDMPLQFEVSYPCETGGIYADEDSAWRHVAFSVANDIMRAEREGFEVRPDPDQPGRFYFNDPNGEGSDISFESFSEAWIRVLRERPSYMEAEMENARETPGCVQGCKRP